MCSRRSLGERNGEQRVDLHTLTVPQRWPCYAAPDKGMPHSRCGSVTRCIIENSPAFGMELVRRCRRSLQGLQADDVEVSLRKQRSISVSVTVHNHVSSANLLRNSPCMYRARIFSSNSYSSAHAKRGRVMHNVFVRNSRQNKKLSVATRK